VDEVLMPVLRYWKVLERNDLGPDGEIARQELVDFIDGLEKQADRFEEKRPALKQRLGWVD
ncbi:MAG: acyl-ACP desaturase, partial [Actinomycetota bacterium]